MANIKNIAIIAHVDHGKTTLVDKIMYHCQQKEVLPDFFGLKTDRQYGFFLAASAWFEKSPPLKS